MKIYQMIIWGNKMGSLLFFFFLMSSISSAGGKELDTSKNKMHIWLESSLQRIFPSSVPRQQDTLHLTVARGSRVSFQVGFNSNMKDQTTISCTMQDHTISPLIRYVGLVPLRDFNTDVRKEELDGVGFLPGLLPDPLYPLDSVKVNPFASRSFWITISVPSDMQPGKNIYPVEVKWKEGKETKSKIVNLVLQVSKLVVKPRQNFHVTHWWRGEATSLYYKTELYSERWWQLTRAQMKNLLEHGNDVAFIQNFFELREVFKQPCQMLIVNEVSPGRYQFDWSIIKRFIAMCKELGYKKFEWGHLWLYWGVEDALHIYTKRNNQYELLWAKDLKAMSPVYINFLEQYLPELHTFLANEGILQDSYFHLSDEPWSEHIENYKKARDVLHRIAPWMKVMDALSDIRYGREGLTDIPIPIISSAGDYIKEKIPHWVYFCTGPRDKWLNRLYDTPLVKIRMSGWLFYRFRALGFLHWGYNYWYKLDKEEALDPYQEASGYAYPGIAAGDPFIVYPGPDGPYDSIRWEVFAESLQDYAILQSAGINPEDELLKQLESYEDFPKDEDWLKETLSQILTKF
ncbi:DUF4091 domain-containing protein [Olivibacter sp. CPCC 100613]|uniref:DUF4091 domain-containing protein n=1 Tax=Olivibacter sp. CPCC 100613 TaxID=3079931 RepID=UPI002FF9BAB0